MNNSIWIGRVEKNNHIVIAKVDTYGNATSAQYLSLAEARELLDKLKAELEKPTA